MRASVWQENRILVRISFLLGLLMSLPPIARAEQLPVRTYTTADGLPRDYVLKIVRDSHGFLWFCTGEGLSRFNGYEFTTYGVEHGLPHPFINDLLETRKGVYWVATNGGGVCRFDPNATGKTPAGNRMLCTVFPVGSNILSNRVNVLYEDRRERLWAGS